MWRPPRFLFAVRWVKIDRGSSRQRVVDVIRFDAGDLVLDESHPPPNAAARGCGMESHKIHPGNKMINSRR